MSARAVRLCSARNAHTHTHTRFVRVINVAIAGIVQFRDKALMGLASQMAAWPTIVATESLTEEQIRLMLPLAWRVRVSDTPQHRNELRLVWAALNATIVRRIGVPCCTMSPYGQTCPPCTDNACYGNGERSVCQASGDPASDVLYESNFLLLNLIEAHAATGEEEYVGSTLLRCTTTLSPLVELLLPHALRGLEGCVHVIL